MKFRFLAVLVAALSLPGCVEDLPPDELCAEEVREQRIKSDDQCLDLIELLMMDCAEWDVNLPGGWDP